MQIIIDGYNLLNALSYDYLFEREDLLNLLENYRRQSKNKVTVVFDSYKAGLSSDTKEKKGGVNVIFTALGKTADQKIKEILKQLREGAIVVSSDNDIIYFAKSVNAGYIRSEDFLKRLFNTNYKFVEDDYYSNKNKKGNPRRPKKAERKRLLKLKKL